MAVRGDNLKLSLLASASNNEGNAALGTIAGSTATPISMSEFHISGQISGISGFTYVVESTFDSYTLEMTGSGARFNIVDLPQNFTWGISPTGSNPTQFINITGSASSSAQIYVSEMNPEAPGTQTTLVTASEHYISASFADGFNTNVTGYNTIFGKTIYSVDTYNSNTLLCLAADMPVTLYDGTEIEIGDLFEGDTLLGYDITTLGEHEDDYLTWDVDTLEKTPVPVTVKSVIYSFSDRIYNINNDELRATFEHPLLVKDGVDGKYRFKEVGLLTTDDKLIKDDSEVDITSIYIEEGNDIEIVSIDVEPQDVFVVNGYINHNKGGNEHTDLGGGTGSFADSILAAGPLLYFNSNTIDSTANNEADLVTYWDDSGSLALTASAQGNPKLTVGKTGRQIEFDGTGDYFDITGSSELNLIPGTDSFTIIVREGDKVPDGIDGYFIAKADDGGSLRSYGLGYDGSAGTIFGVAGGTTLTIATGSMYNQAGNRLIIYEANASETNLYINGVKYNSGAPGTNTASASVNIGGRTDGGFLLSSGSSVELVALIPKILSDVERAAIENEFIYDYNELPNLYGDTHGSATYPDSTNIPPGGWSTSGTVVATTVSGSGEVYRGTTALKVEGSTTGAYIYETFWNTDVQVGDLIRLSGRYKVVASSSNAGMTALIYNSTAPAPSWHSVTLDESEEGVWKRFEVEYPRKVDTFFDIELESSDGTVIFDDLRITNLSAGATQGFRSYNTDAVAFIETASIDIKSHQKGINYLTRQLKINGWWDANRNPAFWPFAGATSGSQKFNLFNPADTDAAHRLEYIAEGAGKWNFDERGTFTSASSATDGAPIFTHYYIDDDWGAESVTSASLSGSIHFYANMDLYPWDGTGTGMDAAKIVSSMWNGNGKAVVQFSFYNTVDEGGTIGYYHRFGDSGTNTPSVPANVYHKGGRGMYSAFTSQSATAPKKVGFANKTRVQTPQTITDFYANADNRKGLAIAGLHSGTNPPTLGSHFYGPSHSTLRVSFYALIGGDFNEEEVITMHDMADQYNMMLHRNYLLTNFEVITDILEASGDDFAGAYWSPNSLNEPDNISGSAPGWTIEGGGTYTVETGSQNVLFGTTALHYSGGASADDIVTEFDSSYYSISDTVVVRGYTKWLAPDSGDTPRITLFDSINGSTSHNILTTADSASASSSWDYFEIQHNVGELEVQLLIRGGGEYIVDGLEFFVSGANDIIY